MTLSSKNQKQTSIMQKIAIFFISIYLLYAFAAPSFESEPVEEGAAKEEQEEQESRQETIQPPPETSTSEPVQTPGGSEESGTTKTSQGIPTLSTEGQSVARQTGLISIINDDEVRKLFKTPNALAKVEPSIIASYVTKYPEDFQTMIQPAIVKALDIDQISSLSKALQSTPVSDILLPDLLINLFTTTAVLTEQGQQELPKITLLNEALAQKLYTKNNLLTPPQELHVHGIAQSIASSLRKMLIGAQSIVRASIASLSKAILTVLYYLFIDTSATNQNQPHITKGAIDSMYVRSRQQIYKDFYQEAEKERQGDFSRPALQAEQKQRARLTELNRAYDLVEQYLHLTEK